jgi:DNA-directed RNA polymerase subunit RPC12/RpoP
MTTPIEGHFGFKVFTSVRAWLKNVLAWGKRIATLEERVTALEAALAKQPGNPCPKCGERAMRINSDISRLWGTPPNEIIRYEQWKCKECGYEEERAVRF